MRHAMQGHPRWMCHNGEFWQKGVHWRREWQTTSVFCLKNPINNVKFNILLQNQLHRISEDFWSTVFCFKIFYNFKINNFYLILNLVLVHLCMKSSLGDWINKLFYEGDYFVLIFLIYSRVSNTCHTCHRQAIIHKPFLAASLLENTMNEWEISEICLLYSRTFNSSNHT